MTTRNTMTDSPFQVLLVARKERFPIDLPQGDGHRVSPGILAEATSAVQDAIDRLGRKGYDAVLCWAEQDSELAAVIRIRKARPDVPIVVFTSSDDARFQALAREAGATRTARPVRDRSALSGFLEQVFRSGELLQELHRQARWTRSQATEIQHLANETLALSREIRGARRQQLPQRFEPLLVEDDPNQAFFMLRAFEKTDVCAPHPVLRTGEEAIRYLAERRDAGTLPTLVLLDVELPGKSGLDVLAWMKCEPGLTELPVVMLSGSANPVHVNRAYELGARSFLTKPTGMDALIGMVRTLKSQWEQSAT